MSARMFLFHQDHLDGKIFKSSYVQENEDKLRQEGWVDTPALLDLPEPELQISAEDASAMAPDELVSMVKSLGFLVMTQDEFDAGVNIAVAQAQDFAKEVDSSNDDDALQTATTFDEHPESLTKDQLIEFGNEFYDLGLKRTMNEATLIEKIQEARS